MTCLYRHFDENGRLLYVGISFHAILRTMAHRQSHWFDQVKWIEVERHTNRRAALKAEQIAIGRERPLHNRDREEWQIVADGKTIAAGMRRGAAKGRVPTGRPYTVSNDEIRAVIHLGTLEAARMVGLSKAQYIARRRRLEAEP